MAQLPTGAPPSAPPAVPHPRPVPPPYYWYPPPAPPDRTLPIVLLVVGALIALPIVIAIVYVFATAPLIGPGDQTNPPVVSLAPATVAGGNVTIDVADASRNAPAALFLFILERNGTRGFPEEFGPSGSAVPYPLTGTTYRVVWGDRDGDDSLNRGDRLSVSGNGVPLGPGAYRFHLLWSDGGEIASTSWTI